MRATFAPPGHDGFEAILEGEAATVGQEPQTESGDEDSTLATRAVARPTLATTLSNPHDVLYANELRRSRVWVWLTTGLSLAGLWCAGWFDDASYRSRIALAAGCGVLFIAAMIAHWLLEDERRYNRTLAAAYSYACLVAVVPAYYFFGWFSAVVLLVPVAGIMFSMGQNTGSVVAMTIATVGSHAAVAVLTMTGVLAESSLMTLRPSGVDYQIAYLVMCETLIITAFAVGRVLRGHALADVERYGNAVRESARREVLLQEALDELARVRHIGEAGRYTGLTLGSYRLGVVLGRGAMGEVYEAEHETTGEAAAVKVLSSSGVIDPRAVARFEREIEIAVTLDSPHVVRVLEHSSADDAVHFLAMERLRGRTLTEWLRAGPRPDADASVDMLRQVARGVDAAHRAGIVHRDLKPGNVFRHADDDGAVWKILDFGVSKLAGGGDTLTRGGIVGTPSYMSPEQASGQTIDHRSDLFALGAIAYRALTGRPPFVGKQMVDVLYAVVHTMPLAPSHIADVADPVDLVLAIALAKDPDHRFDTATALADAVADACRNRISDELERRGQALLALQPWRSR